MTGEAHGSSLRSLHPYPVEPAPLGCAADRAVLPRLRDGVCGRARRPGDAGGGAAARGAAGRPPASPRRRSPPPTPTPKRRRTDRETPPPLFRSTAAPSVFSPPIQPTRPRSVALLIGLFSLFGVGAYAGPPAPEALQWDASRQGLLPGPPLHGRGGERARIHHHVDEEE